MSAVKKDVQAPAAAEHRIRITLASTKLRSVEKVISDLLRKARTEKVSVSGPTRMPTRCLKVTTKSSPNGQGSKTWDRYEMRVYKRVLDINAPADTVRKITMIAMDPAVDIEVAISA